MRFLQTPQGTYASPRVAARTVHRPTIVTQIHCDAALPQCNWCQHQNTPCTFNLPYGRPKVKKRTKADE